MKRILIIVNVFHPDRGGGGAVFSDLCFGLAEKGHEVTVFTTNPYYPEWTNKSGANPWKLTREEINGVEVFRHGIYIPKDPSKLLHRVIYEASFSLSLMRSLFRGGRFDMVMAYCPLLGGLPFALLRKWFKREKLWLNVQDIPSDAAASTGFGGGSLFTALADRIQKFLFRSADVASTISPVMQERVAEICGDQPPVYLLPNWLNQSIADHINAIEEPERAPDRLPRILYAGNIGKKQDTRRFCSALAESDSKFRFRIFGDGGEAKEVKGWIDESGDERFSHGDFMSEDRFIEELSACDFFVITEKSGIGGSFIPCKLIPCISLGTPVIAVCDPDSPLGTEVSRYDLGIILPWREIDSLGERMPELLKRREEFSANCTTRASFYSRERNIDRVIDISGSLCDTEFSEKPELLWE
ncbi:MAG: glycosyltransferase family 4 protein [Verrucomicrobiota bacterium]